MISTSVARFTKPDEPLAIKISNTNQRNFDGAYMERGSSCTPGGLQPVCVICGMTLSQTIQPSLLCSRGTFIQNLNHCKESPGKSSMPKDKTYQHSRQHLKKHLNVSSKCLQASYAISPRAVKCNTPHNVIGELVIPSTIEITPIMLYAKTASQN